LFEKRIQISKNIFVVKLTRFVLPCLILSYGVLDVFALAVLWYFYIAKLKRSTYLKNHSLVTEVRTNIDCAQKYPALVTEDKRKRSNQKNISRTIHYNMLKRQENLVFFFCSCRYYSKYFLG
jgi:hypothetical protein